MPGSSAIPSTVAHSLSEADFQQQVIDLAALYGWKRYHTRDSRGSDAGWPDLVLARPPRLLFVELKSETGRLSLAQSDWLRVLGECAVTTRVWRPSDWPEIEQTLRLGGSMPRAP